MRPKSVTLSSAATSDPILVTWNQANFNISLGLSITGTSTSKVQFTVDSLQDTSITPSWIDHATLQGITADAFSTLRLRCQAVRLVVTAYTNGSVRLTVIQVRPER